MKTTAQQTQRSAQAIYALAKNPLHDHPDFLFAVSPGKIIFSCDARIAKRFDNLLLAGSYAAFLKERGHAVWLCLLDPDPKIEETGGKTGREAQTPASRVLVQGLRGASTVRDWQHRR